MRKLITLSILLTSACMQLHASVDLKAIDTAIKKIIAENPDSAISIVDEALYQSILNTDSQAIAHLYFQKGYIYAQINQQNLSANYFLQAIKIFEKLKDTRALAMTYRSFAANNRLTRMQKITFLKKAEELSYQENDSLELLATYTNWLSLYIDPIKIDSLELYYSKIKDISNSIKHPYTEFLISAINFRINMYKSNYDRARQAIQHTLHLMPKEDPLGFRPYLNLMHLDYYLKINQFDSALVYYEKQKPQFASNPERAKDCYLLLADYYEGNHNTSRALNYFKKADSVKDILFSEADESLLASLEFEYEAKTREREVYKLSAEVEKANYMRSFLLSILFVVLLFSVITTYQIRARARKKRELLRAREKLISAELKNSELERETLMEELQYTNKELTSFATNIVQNHETIENLRKQVHAIVREKSLKIVRDRMEELDFSLMQIAGNNYQRQEFIKRSRELNHKLVYYLKKKFPDLTETDINILILTLLKFRSKEVSILYNIEARSVDKRRYRLRKKLGMDNLESFESFFDRIMPEVSKIIRESIAKHRLEETRGTIGSGK